MNGLVSDCNSQIPTSLVVTQNEQMSSIDTQYPAICSELKTKINAICLQLDPQKCTSMKMLIEHIQSQLKDALGIPQYDKNESGNFIRGTRPGEVLSEHEESGDEVKLRIPMDNSSDEDENEEEEKEDTGAVNKSLSTNHVSTIKPASFFDSSDTFH